MKILLVVIVSMVLNANFAMAGSPCEEEAMETLFDLEIEGNLAKVTKTKLSQKSGKIKSYRHWFRTPRCEFGYVIVHTTKSCRTFETYTQNGCKIDGLKSWLPSIKR